MKQIYSWQVRSSDCFAKVIDSSLLNEGVTGIPQAVVLVLLGRLLEEKEEIYINLVAGELNVICKLRRFKNRHRLFMPDFKTYLREIQADVDDLLIFDRSLLDDTKFYVSAIDKFNSLIISPLATELRVGENIKTSSQRRIGQEAFRELLIRKYDRRCCLSGVRDIAVPNKSILRASHIKPWKKSDQYEKVDVNNGLLLAPQYDILFDKHLISFNRNGTIIKSKYLSLEISSTWLLDNLQLNGVLNDEMETYMAQHRQNIIL